MNIDERLEALTMNLEEAHMRLIQIDAENICALARIAEAHEKRLDRLN